MTTIDRAELRKLADAATPGPWENTRNGVQQALAAATQVGDYRYEGVGIVPEEYVRQEDAEFIAASREAVPALLVALTRAEAQSETRRQQTAYWQERAEGFEARIADVLALCDEWAAMGTRSMNIGAVRRALESATPPGQ